MRRLLAAIVVTTVLLTGVGCSGGRADDADRREPVDGRRHPCRSPPPWSPSVAVSGSPAGGNGRRSAREAEAASTTAVRTYVEELGKMIAAVGANDSAAAGTPPASGRRRR